MHATGCFHQCWTLWHVHASEPRTHRSCESRHPHQSSHKQSQAHVAPYATTSKFSLYRTPNNHVLCPRTFDVHQKPTNHFPTIYGHLVHAAQGLIIDRIHSWHHSGLQMRVWPLSVTGGRNLCCSPQLTLNCILPPVLVIA